MLQDFRTSDRNDNLISCVNLARSSRADLSKCLYSAALDKEISACEQERAGVRRSCRNTPASRIALTTLTFQ
jgi:hypothetical protein